MGKIKNLTGHRFERITVLSFCEIRNHAVYWNCICDCGAKTIVKGSNLLSGRTKSCGCYQKDAAKEFMTKHGQTDSRLHNIWIQMRSRCDKPFNQAYGAYGGRGISVCAEWQSFDNFFNWSIKNGYAEDLSIDRVDVNGNYEPGNCRWATRKQQCRNTRSNRLITYCGETHCVAEWAEITGIQRDVLTARVGKLHWDTCRALTTPTKHFNRRSYL